MIFLTGQHHGQDVILATPSATLWPTQGQSLHQHAMGDTTLSCLGWIPWIDRQGVRQARRPQSDDVDNNNKDGDSDSSNANDRDGGNDCNNNKDDVDDNGGSNDYYDNNDVNDDDNDNNNNNGTTMMRWWRQQWNNDNWLMTMWWQWACKPCVTHPRQQSTYVDSLGRSRRERGTILGDGRTEKGQGGSNWVEVTSSPLDQFQIHFTHTPEWHPILHVSWELGCAIGAMVSMFNDNEKEEWKVSVGQSFGRGGLAHVACISFFIVFW